MLIGLDFDNTIVSYDGLFHRVALEQGLIPADLPVSKVDVRDHLRRVGQEDRWTAMQGYVYGARMDDAVAYPGAVEFMRRARAEGIELAIVSHKTKHPFLGPAYDLHAAARQWVLGHLRENDAPLIPERRMFFELTKADKNARIAALGCDYFIDDLPEILLAPDFPSTTRAVLFDPDDHHREDMRLVRVSRWADLPQVMDRVWTATRL
jgi:hypothetical protein